MNGVGMLVGNFELNPLRRPIWAWPKFFWPLKETMLIHRQYGFFYIFSSATLNEIWWRFAQNTLSQTKILNLHPYARRRASPPLSYAEFPPPPGRRCKNYCYFSENTCQGKHAIALCYHKHYDRMRERHAAVVAMNEVSGDWKNWGLFFYDLFQACALSSPVAFLTGDHVHKSDLTSSYLRLVNKRSGIRDYCRRKESTWLLVLNLPLCHCLIRILNCTRHRYRRRVIFVPRSLVNKRSGYEIIVPLNLLHLSTVMRQRLDMKRPSAHMQGQWVNKLVHFLRAF